VLVITGTVFNCTAASSEYGFDFGPTDLSAAPGTYEFEIQFDDGAGGVITYSEDGDGNKLKFKLREEIA
jgi:hypothetical protein